MTEKPVEAKIIKKTQDTLGKVIKKPPMTEKLLNKPPFRFLHDIVTSVIKSTGFMKGLFTDDELISDNVKEKDSKIIFLQKVMDMISLVTGKTLSAKPSKIIAGQEAEKTNEFLQMLADACSKKIDNDDYVKRVLSTDDYIIPKKNKKIKDEDEIEEKPKKVKESSNENTKKENKDKHKNKEKQKEKQENPKEKSEKSKSKDPEKKKKIIDENRDENRGDKIQEKSPEKAKEKSKEKSKESDKEKIKEVDKKKESKPKEKETKERDGSREKKIVQKSSKDEEDQDAENETPVLKAKSKPKKLDELNDAEEKPRKITRPNSSKPAPKIKPTEPGDESASLNGLNRPAVIIDREDNSDDDMFIAADAEDVAPISNDPPKKLEDEEEGEHGGLVKKILETKKDLEASTQNKKTEIERQSGAMDASKRKERDAMQKDIDRLRASIQALTRGVNPLGKVLDFLQEDFDSMQREIQTWSDENKKNVTDLIREQSFTESSIVPLKGQLRDLDLSIRDQLEQIAAVKNNILNNDKKLFNLLSSITKS